jgi:hypothetical protein
MGGVFLADVWYYCGGWLGVIMEGMPPFHKFGHFWF